MNSNEQQLLRLTLAHMLWENQFYVSGQESATALQNAVKAVKPDFASAVAQLARTNYKLRHVPLAIMRELARTKSLKAEALNAVIQRPDEMGEFLAIYWKDGRQPIANQVKRGLAMAFNKFSEYQLAKWDKNSAAVSLKDVLFLTHPKPQTAEQEVLFRKIAQDKLETPDTWEVRLSAGENKREVFEDLMANNKLGALAFLRNLRNMVEAGVPISTIVAYAGNLDVSKVLPFRYLAAYRAIGIQYVELTLMLQTMMFRSVEALDQLPGRTLLLVDVSGSMFGNERVSKRSDLNRFDAAAALAILANNVCEKSDIFTFSSNAVRVNNPSKGFDLWKQLESSQYHGGTALGYSLKTILSNGHKYDRTIVFTDEQSYDTPQLAPALGKGYILNVASYKNGIEDLDSGWETITGFSEAVLDYIKLREQQF